MKWLCAIAALSIVAPILIGCSNSTSSSGSSGTQYPGVGPFDAHGNYVEEWADNPSKWKRPGAAPRKSAPQPIPQPQNELAVIDQPPMDSIPLATTPSRAAVQPKPSTSNVRSAEVKPQVSRPVVREVEVKPKPKPKLVKAKPKPKPKATRYVVKKGDTLSAIASRQGSSVAAIRKANGISGSIIRPGQSLVIPKP